MKKYNYMYVYKITCKINNKIYIGSHRTNNMNDGYFGSGLLIGRAINKQGKENFIIEIIENCNSVIEMKRCEEKYIKFYNSTHLDIGYNVTKFACGGQPITQEAKNKISIKMKGRKLSEDHKEKLRVPKSRRTVQHNKNLSIANKGKQQQYNIETGKAKQFNVNIESIPVGQIRGRPKTHMINTKTDVAIEKQRQSMIGKKQTSEHRMKTSEIMKQIQQKRKIGD